MKLLIATRNKNKLKEYQDLLSDLEILSLDSVNNIPKNLIVEETGKTFEENASIKAKEYGQLAGIATLADDSGLVIDFLNGQPGIHSARFAKGNYLQANNKILNLLKHQPLKKRSARFIISLAFYQPLNQSVISFSGTAEGFISQKILGNKGFGYDPIFLSSQLNLTFGQASNQQKFLNSHRSKAVKKFLNYLNLNK